MPSCWGRQLSWSLALCRSGTCNAPTHSILSRPYSSRACMAITMFMRRRRGHGIGGRFGRARLGRRPRVEAPPPPPWAGPGQHEAFTVALSMRAVRWPPSKWPPVALPAWVSAPTRHVGPCHRSPPRGCRACQFFPF